MKGVILDCDSLGPRSLDLGALLSLPIDWTVHAETAPRQVGARIADAEIVLTNKAPVTASSLSQAPALKLISVLATGINVIDLKAASERGVAVCNSVKYSTGSVVQHVWALILTLVTRLNDYQQAALDGTWQQSPFFCLLDFPVEELHGKVLGIVGAGDLGRAVAKVGEAFGMRVIYAALPGRDYSQDSDAGQSGPQRVEFSEFLRCADIISLHCPLTAETDNLIAGAELALMKPSSILINTARGGIVNEAALKRALKSNDIAGAGLDVLTSEPPRNGNLLLDRDLGNLVVTPHCAWVARQSRQRLVDQTVENLRAFLQGEPMLRAVL